jgi:hypothetical protein
LYRCSLIHHDRLLQDPRNVRIRAQRRDPVGYAARREKEKAEALHMDPKNVQQRARNKAIREDEELYAVKKEKAKEYGIRYKEKKRLRMEAERAAAQEIQNSEMKEAQREGARSPGPTLVPPQEGNTPDGARSSIQGPRMRPPSDWESHISKVTWPEWLLRIHKLPPESSSSAHRSRPELTLEDLIKIPGDDSDPKA